MLGGDDATSARVAELAESVDVLHLAGHGRHTGENPLFSAVELVDGPWFGYDIDELRRTPSTVVLSACELGRVSVRSGEEAIGMSAAWLHAGARTVLSSPVLIADDVACDAMARWHTLLAAGAAPADALAQVSAEADDVVPDAQLRRRLVDRPPAACCPLRLRPDRSLPGDERSDRRVLRGGQADTSESSPNRRWLVAADLALTDTTPPTGVPARGTV